MKQIFSSAGERFWMFTIAAIALAIIGFICVSAVVMGRIPEGAEGLFNGAVTGLLLVARDVIRAIIEMLGGKEKKDAA